MRVAVLGAGAVGARAVRQLASSTEVDEVAVADRLPERAERVAAAVAQPARVVARGDDRWWLGADVAVLACSPGQHPQFAHRLLGSGASVISVSDDVEDVEGLLALDAEARQEGMTVVAGAGFAPGLSCVLAAHAGALFDQVEEVHVAKVGTGGPACARAHHRALGAESVDWRDGSWLRRGGGSGRELCWFPEPAGAQDCYRSAAPDALLLVPAFPGVARATARVGASRRDRLTTHLPMLRRPHPEGRLGAVRVEVRGRRGEARDTAVLGAVDRPAVAAGAVAALAAVALGQGRLARTGAGGLAELADPVELLSELARRGVKAAAFDGTGRSDRHQ